MGSNLKGRRMQINILRTKQVSQVEMTTVSRSQVATTRNAGDGPRGLFKVPYSEPEQKWTVITKEPGTEHESHEPKIRVPSHL